MAEHVIPEGWVDSRQAAEATGYTPEHLSRLARTGKVRAVRVGRDWLIDQEDVLRWRAEARPGPKPKAKRTREG